MPWDANVIPKTVELAFDNLCNLACSYCNAEFSSTWNKDITTKGPYENMKTSGGHTFKNTGHHAMPYGSKNQRNPYIAKFMNGLKKLDMDYMNYAYLEENHYVPLHFGNYLKYVIMKHLTFQ